MATVCTVFVQLSEVRREHENAAKLRQQEHSSTVARLEASHASNIAGTPAMYLLIIAFVIYWPSARYCVTFCTTRPFDGVVHATFSCQALTIMYICRRPVGLVDLTTAQQNQVYISAEWYYVSVCYSACLSVSTLFVFLSVGRNMQQVGCTFSWTFEKKDSDNEWFISYEQHSGSELLKYKRVNLAFPAVQNAVITICQYANVYLQFKNTWSFI